jgi:mRNA-degrading endonuclease RelE of RelBE toxin-antitoxin system
MIRMKIEVGEQVAGYVRSLPPEPRRTFRLAIRALADFRGDIRVLEGPLSGYSRLRVGAHRLIFKVQAVQGEGPRIDCLFAAHRGVVYAVFEGMLARELTRPAVPTAGKRRKTSSDVRKKP